MIKRKNKFAIIFILTFISLSFFSCKNKVIITREYIYSTSWAKGSYQGFQIAKIRLKDTTILVSDKKFNRYYLDNYTIDSIFCYTHFTGNEKYNSKTYFGLDNKGPVWRKCSNLYEEKKVLGLLELNTWYIITGLYGTEDFYVFIDKNGGSHVYSLGPENW
ncbi:MAG: hypothetical protein U0T11_08640 [Chitinophagaceae bacterium]